MTAFFLSAVLSLVTITGSSLLSKVVYHGCYENANLNRTINTLKKKATGLGSCVDFCSISGSNYAALHGTGDCYCLQDLTKQKKVEEARCTQKCPQLAHLNCGGPGAVSIFTTGSPIVFNVSFKSEEYTGLSNATTFIVYGSLTRLRQFDNESSSESGRTNVTLSEYISRNSVSVTWKIDGASTKRVNKTVKDYHFNDTLNYGFKAHGKHEVCFNVSNTFSWVVNCSSIIALENIHTLELISIQGGKQTTTGKYAIEESTSFHIDVVVNAGSFADLHVDFGDGSGVSAVRKGYHATRKNCSCLALTRKGHLYRKRGVFSLNITALNELERKEIIYNETIVVEGKITGATIKTKHAAAGVTSKVYVDVYGSAKDVVYQWNFAGGRQEKTDVPFIDVDFPNNVPQFRIEMKVFNNISGVTVEGVIYIEPTIRNVTIRAGMSIAVIEKDVVFTVQSIVDYTTFATTKRYTWDLGNGHKLGGTLDKLVYRYKKSGRFHARVMVENFVSKVFSNYVEIQVYEKITKITLSYKPFIFGETAELNAHVNDGSNVTYIWNFGDSNSLTTNSATVYHLFNSPGNYTVTVQARNPVSQKRKSIEIFVTSYACQKPVVAFSRGSYEENIKLSSEIRLDVDVSVSCSISRRTKYQWKIFNMTGGRKMELSHTRIGVSQAILTERSLILPPFSLKHGKFEIELKVDMEGTIVYSRISKLVNILPTGLQAYILGGTLLSVGRKSHQNITLDGSYSYDPDEKHSSKLSFFWECRSIQGSAYETCFKPNTTMGFNWSTPVLQFLPKILVKSADMFAFMVTISKPGLNNATAVQFLKLEEGTYHSLKIGCAECRAPDVNTHQDLRFTGTCNDCGNTPVSYRWKVYAAPKVKIFLRLFGKCIPSDGSAWEGTDTLKNSTNATTTQIPTTLETTTLGFTTTKLATTKANTAETDFQKLICEADLKALKKNATGLVSKSRKRRNVDDLDREEDSELESVEGEFETENDNLKWDLADDKSEEDKQDAIDDEVAQERYRRDLSSDGSSDPNDANGVGSPSGAGQPNADDDAAASDASSNSSVRVLRVAGGVGSGQSNGNAGIGTADASGGSGFPRPNRPDASGSISGSGRGPTVTGTGSGRPQSNSGGSGRGCEGSSGVGGGRGIGSGSGARPGCSGSGSGFGDGAKNHANKTGGSTSNGTADRTGGNSGNLIHNSRDKELKAKSEMIREVMHPIDLQTVRHSGSKSKNFLLEKNSLVPGQLYMIEFTAKWDHGGETRVAGNAKSFFFTNTGPYQGFCKLQPRIGREIATTFFLSCDHWKDKHFPLQFSVRYKVLSDQNYTLMYTGLHTDLNFSLPAGDVNRNYTIDLEVIVTDTEGVQTNLCPISVQVLPLIEVKASVEEMLYNKTIGNDSLLKYNEDVSDVLQAAVLISSIANTINRLPSVSVFSSKNQLRKEIRERLLKSLLKFTIHDEVFSRQILSITTALTKKETEVTLASVNSSNKINKKVILFYKTTLRSFSLDVIKKIFVILSNALATTSQEKIQKSDQLMLKSLVKDIIRIHDEIVQIKQSTSTTQSQPLILKSDILTTIASRFDKDDEGTLSSDGCSFVLPSELQGRIQNLTSGSSSAYSTFSIYERSPFVWDKMNATISTKVSSLDFKNLTGGSIEVSNLTQPVRITLPVQTVKREVGMQVNAVQLAKMNIHDFNLTGGQSSTYFIIIEDTNEEERSRSHLLKAIVRYNEAPTQRLFNHSLTFINKTASLYINPESDVKTIVVGVFLQTLGRETKKKKSVPKAQYKIRVYNARCLFWDEKNDVWNDQGCVASPESTPSEVVCSCNHLTAFGGQIEYVPYSVSVQSLIDFKSVDDPYIVLVTVLSLIGLYLLLIVYFGIIERSRRRMKSFAVLPDNHPADLFRYLVIVETGNSVNAGTTARVSMVVHGKEGHSQIRELTCHDASIFGRGATDCIIMSFPDSLGDIKKIRLWHDNGGTAPDWFLKQMTIVDCQTEKRWYFHWNNWLAITENTKVDCELPAKMVPLIYNLQVIFEGFLDYHSWISIFTRPDRSNYSHIQRLTAGFTSIAALMFLAAACLSGANLKNVEILGIWDINWISILISIVMMSIIFPIQLLAELLFRNCSRIPRGKLKKDNHAEETSENKIVPEKGQEMGHVNGAFFFMEVSTETYSSQNVLCDDEDNNLRQNNIVQEGSNSRFGISLPHWCGYLLTGFCLLLSAVAIYLTLLYGISFPRNTIVLWAQALILSISYSIGILEIIKALFLATYRLFKLSREALIRDFLSAFRCHDEAGVKDQVKRNEMELTEKQIMAARARARFVRFSKPLVGECLRKARQKAKHWNNITFYMWQSFTLTVYLTTLGLALCDTKTKDEYLRQNAIKDTIMSPATELSFGDITTQSQFWNWSELKLVDILRWDSWHNLRSKKKGQNFQKLYIFGPARMQSENELQSKEKQFSNTSQSPISYAEQRKEVLLFGNREKMLTTLRNMQSTNWMSKETKRVTICFSYYQPPTSVFSYVQLIVDNLPTGSIETSVQIDNAKIYSDPSWIPIAVNILNVLSLFLVLLSLRKEFCCLMDNGFSHLKSGWNFIEAIFIILVLYAVLANINVTTLTQRALHKISMMEVNDSDAFLDLKVLIEHGKILQVVYATLLFLVLLKCLRILTIWKRFAVYLSTLERAFTKLLPFMVVLGVTLVALSHTAVLLFRSYSPALNKNERVFTSLLSIFHRSNSFPETIHSCWLLRMLKVIAVITLFVLWRLSAVFFMGQFKAAQSTNRRSMRLLKKLKKGFRKLQSKKTWVKLWHEISKRIFRKQEEKYKVCNLPLENVYEEIEYQVEEVLFRLNNLFDLQDRPDKFGGTMDDDDYTLDSSEEAAYPSSFSTKDNISFTSESIYSDDSGYYRYGDYRGRYGSTANSDDDYEGPIIHHLDEPKQRLSDLGQIISPIFGGRYFVKTSWSTFRAPKIKPGSVDLKPLSPIKLPVTNGRKTFEKIKNWGSKNTVPISVPEEIEPRNSFDNFLAFPNAVNTHKEPDVDNSLHSTCANPKLPPLVNPERRLPRALEAMSDKLKLAPRHTDANSPFKQPPKLPSISEIMAQNRKRRSLKRTQILPIEIDSPSSVSFSSDNESLFRGSVFQTETRNSRKDLPRSPSLDSGIIRNSETDESEISHNEISDSREFTSAVQREQPLYRTSMASD